MASERRYYDDTYTTRFEAAVAAAGEWQGRPAVELERTWFYPESGGQLPDRGTLGGSAVVDVQAAEDGRVWHVVEGALPPGAAVAGEIDWARRFDHMQQHTGQHVLSAAFERVRARADALLDAGRRAQRDRARRCAEMDWRLVARIEEAANRVLWEDREVRLHWTDAEGVRRFALRKPPQVEGRIRVVEMPDWDVSACGGTHTRRTGRGGRDQGRRLGEGARQRARGVPVRRPRAARPRVAHRGAARGGEAPDAQGPRPDRAPRARARGARRAREAAARAERRGGSPTTRARSVGEPPRGVAEWADARGRDDVRAFALACLTAGAPWVVSGAAGPDPVVVVARAKGAGPDLKAVLPDLLAAARGKGGGSPEMLQVAAADAAGAEAAFALARDRLASAPPLA